MKYESGHDSKGSDGYFRSKLRRSIQFYISNTDEVGAVLYNKPELSIFPGLKMVDFTIILLGFRADCMNSSM